MTQRRNRVAAATVAALALGGAALAAASPATAHMPKDTRTTTLLPLNNSGTHGYARATVRGNTLDVKVNVNDAVAAMPHAQHIHFGEKARHECPTSKDAGQDFRLSTVDGQPAYGPIAASLTTRGDTSPQSGLAVDRFPVANAQGDYRYLRKNIEVSKELARAVMAGQGVVVVHGVDYNGNGKYDFEGAGVSELTPGQAGEKGVLPAEATDPASCGVLHR